MPAIWTVCHPDDLMGTQLSAASPCPDGVITEGGQHEVQLLDASDYPLEESMRTIRLADELGFYACYAADETWHKDLWLLFAAAARDTTNIRLGPSVSGVVPREPTLIAQAVATLDELTNGRASGARIRQLQLAGAVQHQLETDQAAVPGQGGASRSSGDYSTTVPSPVDGEFFKYHGLFTFARPVQERLPVKIGAMRGPKSFEAAGEFSDGCHHCLSYKRQAYDYAFEHFRTGAERAGKNPDDLDFGAGSRQRSGRTRRRRSRQLARWSGSTPRPCRREQLARNGVDPEGAHSHRRSHE